MGQEHNNTRSKKWEQLTEKERYKIEALCKIGMSAKEIGKQLKRDRRTIEREIERGMTVQRKSDWREKKVYGIDFDKISKLEIRKGNKFFANYDRGWDIEVQDEATGVLDTESVILNPSGLSITVPLIWTPPSTG